jgi:hypothetical protein
LSNRSGEKNNKKRLMKSKKSEKKTSLALPDFEKECHVYTDTSKKQLVAVIMQEGKTTGFL